MDVPRIEGARKTLLYVSVAFDREVYGDLIRQAELALHDVERATHLANALKKP
jgi:hypothetical protein